MRKYPTIVEVKNAEIKQLGIWLRFLPSPGMNYLQDQANAGLGNAKELTEGFDNIVTKEKDLLILIIERIDALGGISKQLSDEIGWDPLNV